tara:strand:+ start:953 stop:3337 length:2385 start_codon:yes stop_codon:yes gene_type:complete
MPHVSGHKGQTGLMSNPYKQAAESMKQAGISGFGDVGIKQRKQTSKKNINYVPPPPSGRITETQPKGPVGGTGNSNWNAGWGGERESNEWDKLREETKDKNRVLNQVVEKYNKSWLGAHNEFGNFEDDLPITKAAKFTTNFLLRATSLPFELGAAKFVGDPAANIYEGLQEAGYIKPTGTKTDYFIDKATGMYLDANGMAVSGMYPDEYTSAFDNAERIAYTQPSPIQIGTGAKNAAEVATAIYAAPSLFKLGGLAIVGGYKKVQNFFKPKEPIKGNLVIDDLTNASVGASYKPEKFVKKLADLPDGYAPHIEGYTGYVTLVNKNTGKEWSGTTVASKTHGFATNEKDYHIWTDGKYYTGRKENHFSNINPAEPLDEVVIYHKNQNTVLSAFDDQFDMRHTMTTDNSGVLLHHHLDEAYQVNQSFVEGVPIINNWKRAEGRLEDVIYNSYKDSNSKLNIALQEAGITPENNPSMFKFIKRDGEVVPVPKVVYHGTSKIFTNGLKGDAIKISSPDGSKFIGGTDNLEKTLPYIMDVESLDNPLYIQPRVYISIPKVKNTFDIGRNNEHLEFAINHIANQRFNHWQGNKVLKWEELDDTGLPYPSAINMFSADDTAKFKGFSVDDWKRQVKSELLNDNSNWKPLEKEMRVFADDGTVTPNHIIKDKGFDSFVTVERGADELFGNKGDMNIMIFEPEKNLMPISTVIDGLKPQKYSEFLSKQLNKPNQGYGGGWNTVGQYMHKWEERIGSGRPDIKPEETGNKILLELLGDAGETINQPITPFDNKELEADNFARFV